MKTFAVATIAVLAGLSQASAVPRFAPLGLPNSCGAFPTKLPKLSACSTASAFCQAYIGSSSGTCTRTFTTSTTVPASAATTVTSTSTVYITGSGTTKTVTAPNTVTVSYNKVYTLTSLAATCSQAKVKRSAAVTSFGADSCGLRASADPRLVSGACNVFLGSQTTTTLSFTSAGSIATDSATVTITIPSIDATVTSIPTSTVYTSTIPAAKTACATACPSSDFVLRAFASGSIINGDYLEVAAIGGPVSFNLDIFTATRFALDATTGDLSVGALTPTGIASTLANTSSTLGFDGIVFEALGANLGAGGVLHCAFNGGVFGCTVGDETGFSSAGAALNVYKSGSLPAGQFAVALQGFCPVA